MFLAFECYNNPTGQPTMTRFTLEIETDGSNDIINLNAPLKPRIRELKGEGILHLFIVGSTAASHHDGI